MIGRGIRGAGDALMAFRYECKYLVEEGQARMIRDFIRPFVRADGFAAARGSDRYPVCSLYFDTADLLLYRQSLHGVRDRYKLRIRSYSDDPGQPLFLEIKRRLDGAVLKRRCVVDRACLERALAGGAGWPGEARGGETGRSGVVEGGEVVAEFAHLARLCGCGPVMRVRYLREACESAAGDPVRVTFDTGLCHAVTLEHDLSLDGAGWSPTPVEGTILEIKFTDRYPSWVRGLLQAFDLQRLSIPKYGLSMGRALAEGRFPGHGPAAFRAVPYPGRRSAGVPEA